MATGVAGSGGSAVHGQILGGCGHEKKHFEGNFFFSMHKEWDKDTSSRRQSDKP